ncbi:sugar ABC transporter ATP-binding protein [Ventosimonas gracilis]|uniref:Sugar ABC transporter ATP-binding protein n=1 Tax=Ventosimonas gracilis TaxID=1680762 RepID=A0A139SQQ9_9GAMM|nr:ABC transporter ATP-binding protein [Ventosimonas gracilis]KXU36939.1 sugar ABC transporter ATP-binding protein [Ventosimonas gracilis]
MNALELTGISKRFGSLLANDNISLTLKSGEVLALLGENGAGKSTLVSILFGHYRADSGHIKVFGEPLPAARPDLALKAGIGMVHQHFTLADNLSVLDNILVGTEPLWHFRSQRGKACGKLTELGQRFGLQVDSNARVGSLSVGEKQRVEILKALYRGARILILDEPTAVLTPQESEALFATLREFVAGGLSVIFISHKLDEVMAIASRVVILRHGKRVAECTTQSHSAAQLAELMVGRKVLMPRLSTQAKAAVGAAPLLRLIKVSAGSGRGALQPLSLSVQAGEILAIAGVSGNGQQTLVSLLCGLIAPTSGHIQLRGQSAPKKPAQWTAAGVSRIPEDRQQQGSIGDCPLWENAIAEDLSNGAFVRFGLIRQSAAKRFTRALMEQFDVRADSIETPAKSLSGGNLQKLIVGRALSREPQLIVADQPTWGLDIGAVAYVREQLLAARERGAGILLVSEDLAEVFALADRIAVLCGGRLVACKAAAEWDLTRLGLAMMGHQEQEEAAAC